MCCSWRGTQFINLQQELKKVSNSFFVLSWLVIVFLLEIFSKTVPFKRFVDLILSDRGVARIFSDGRTFETQ